MNTLTKQMSEALEVIKVLTEDHNIKMYHDGRINSICNETLSSYYESLKQANEVSGEISKKSADEFINSQGLINWDNFLRGDVITLLFEYASLLTSKQQEKIEALNFRIAELQDELHCYREHNKEVLNKFLPNKK